MPAPCAADHAPPTPCHSFVRNAKFVSESNMPSIMLMARCLVQLYALDPHSAYQHGFVYIRQLALHLRAAINAKTKDAVNNVYCWQYINCLRVSARGMTVAGNRTAWEAALTSLCGLVCRCGPWC